MVTTVIGIDPGLVHTGVVMLSFYHPGAVVVTHHVFNGVDAAACDEIAEWCQTKPVSTPSIFIEGYRPRSAFNSDARMLVGVQAMRKATGGRVLDNTGVKKVVRQNLMELLGVWKFTTITHHQDLRSAARIALLGMMKDEEMNQLLADIVRDNLAGNPWSVQS